MSSRIHRGRIGRLSRACIATSALLGALALAAAPGSPSGATAVDGAIDTTFNTGGIGANGVIRSMAITNDEKIYIAGDFTSYNGFNVGGIARLNPNGAPDLTFNLSGAGFARSSGTMMVRSIALDSDGKIYATGSFTSYNGTAIAQNNVVRLNTDGSLDTGFVPPRFESSNFVGQAASMSLVTKVGDLVLVSGSFDTLYTTENPTPSVYARGLVALTTTGAIDSTFGTNARLADGAGTATAYSIVPVANSTDIYVNGSFRGINSQNALFVARIKNDGSRSLDYANTGDFPAVGPNNSISGMAVQPDGKLLLGGNFTQFNSVTTAKGLVRVNPDATLDTSFTSPANSIVAASLAVDANGRIYVSGGIGTAFGTSTSRAIVRLKSDGTLDPTFDLPLAPTGYDNDVVVSPTGKVFIHGDVTKLGDTTVGRIVRLTVSAPQSSTPVAETPTAPVANPGVVTPAPAALAVPGQPTNIKVTITGTRATVSWSAPTTGGTPTSYTATAVPVGPRTSAVTASSTLSCTATAPATSCTIAGLSTGQKYGFSVSAANASGGSPAAAVAKPVAVPVAKVKKTESLPETGTGISLWLMVSAAALLLLGGAVTRRSRLS